MNTQAEYFQSKLAIAKALGVHRHTIDLWVDKPWFPKEVKGKGYPKEETMKACDKYQLKKEGAGEYASGSKEEKTALECERLKIVIQKELEILEQAREETRRQIEDGKRQTRKLIEKKDVERGLEEFLAKLRNVMESWSKSAIADDPDNHIRYEKAVDLYLDKMNEEFSSITK
jgi:hypothetical protein